MELTSNYALTCGKVFASPNTTEEAKLNESYLRHMAVLNSLAMPEGYVFPYFI